MWFTRLALDPARSYEGLWELSHDWIRRKKETKHRREAFKDTLPGVAACQNNGKGGKGTGKDKNGDPQVCFAWRNTGVCARKDAGTCIYAHPMNMKNIGKPAGDKGKGKDGKRSSSTQSRSGKGGKGQGQPGTPRGGKAVTDPKLLCQNYLKGKCTKGKSCTYHHNGPCSFHKKGTCNKGDKCVFSHHDPAAQPALAAAGGSDKTVVDPKATATPKAKAKDKADAKR